MGESGFLDFVPFALPGVGRLGAYFLIFLFLHSLGFGLRECISCFLDFCTPSILTYGSVILAFMLFAFPRVRLDGVHFMILRLFHSIGLNTGECITCFFSFCTPLVLA